MQITNEVLQVIADGNETGLRLPDGSDLDALANDILKEVEDDYMIRLKVLHRHFRSVDMPTLDYQGTHLMEVKAPDGSTLCLLLKNSQGWHVKGVRS